MSSCTDGCCRNECSETARNGLTTMEHWYGLSEALFETNSSKLSFEYIRWMKVIDLKKLVSLKQAAEPYSKNGMTLWMS